MNEDRMMAVEDGLEELKAEIVALRNTVTAITLALLDADSTTIERIHHQLIEFAGWERRRGSERGERRALATEVLADGLLVAARRVLPPPLRSSEEGDG